MILKNSAEGQSNGTTLTAANSGSGSGDAFSSVSIGSGAALVYSSTSDAHGSQSYALTGASGTATAVTWSAFNDTAIAVRMYYNPGPTLPGSALRLIDIRDSTTSITRISLNTSNKLFMQDYNGTNTKWTAGTALSPNTWYRIEVAISVSASAAVMKCDYYALDSTTTVEAGFSTAAGNTGSTNITAVSIGSAQTATWTGTSYFDDLAASNEGGTSYIGPYATTDYPAAPTSTSAVAGNAQAVVSYSTPVANGGGTITGYTATSTPGGFTGSYTGATASPITVTGLSNGTAYTFTVHATNTYGNSPESAASSAVTPTSVPDPPTGASATAGNAQATISFSPPANNGGSAITGYTVTSSPGALTQSGSGSPITISGLTNGTAYSFTVTATSALGTSGASSASNTVTPIASLLQNSAEGQANGTVPTSANTGGGSGSAFNNVAIGANSTLAFSNTTSAHGTLSYALSGPSTSTSTAFTWSGFNDTQIAVRMYYNPGATLPSSTIRLIDVRSATTSMARISLNTSNKLFMQDYNGTNIKWTAGTALSINTWYRIEMTISVSASAAVMKTDYYPLDSTSPVETGYSTSSGDTGTSNISAVNYGSAQATIWSGTAYFDDMAATVLGGTTYIGPYNVTGKPEAPAAVTATSQSGQATISYTSPVANGGYAITGYTAISTPGSFTGSSSGAAPAPITISGLSNGTAYTFTVHSTNTNGNSTESSSSNNVTPSVVPDAPSNLVASVSSGVTTVALTPPINDGGSSITSYTVTSNPGSITASNATSPIIVPGLTNGTSYTFTATATSSGGTSGSSAASNAVVPFLSPLINNAEGQASGTTLTALNSGGGSGSPFDAITIGSGSALIYSNTTFAHGTQSYALTNSTAASVMSWQSFNDTSIAVRMYYNAGSSLPNVSQRLIDIRSATNSVSRISMNASNQFFMQDYNGTNTKWTAPHAILANTWYRVEIAISISTTAATMKCDYFYADSSSPVETGYTTTTGDTGAANITVVNIGEAAAVSWSGTSFYDDLAATSASTTYVGPPISINPGSNQTVEPWSIVTLDASLSTGAVLTYSWAQTSGTAVTLNGNGAQVTYSALALAAGDTAIFTLTITDDHGNTLNAPVTITTLPVSQLFLNSSSVWTPLMITYL